MMCDFKWEMPLMDQQEQQRREETSLNHNTERMRIPCLSLHSNGSSLLIFFVTPPLLNWKKVNKDEMLN